MPATVARNARRPEPVKPGGPEAAAATRAVAEFWERQLGPGERLLWHGTPEPGLALRAHEWPRLVAGLGIMGVALWWLATMVDPERLRPWGIALLMLGAVVAVGTVVLNRHVRRHTRYALTDRSALIATAALPGFWRVRRYPVGPGATVSHDARTPGSIWFASEVRRVGTRLGRVRIGFHRIADAPQVMALIEALRRGTV